MKRTKRKFTAAFKAQVAIEAIKETETLAELAKRFDIHPNMISNWKKEFLSRAEEIFDSKPPEKEDDEKMEKLYAKIGQLEMERDWLKKISKRAGL